MEKFKKLSKIRLYRETALNKESKVNNDPIFKILFQLDEIQNITNLPNFTKYLYFNRKTINDILYEKEEVIYVDNRLKDKELSFYFYLTSLIEYSPDIINYKYSFEFIKEINKLKAVENNYFRNIIISKIVCKLIDNFKGFDDYGENVDENEINEIENKNKELIKKNIKLIKEFDLNEKFILDNNIDDIYIEIIIQLIKDDKLSNYEYSKNIISQLNLENIDLNENMIDKLSKILDSKVENVQKYIIVDLNNLLDNEKINFHYILLKYIIKNSIYIYHIPFLLKNHKNIIKIINSNIDKLKTIHTEDQYIERLEYILKKYLVLYYYYNKLNPKEKLIHINKSEITNVNNENNTNSENNENNTNSEKNENNTISENNKNNINRDSKKQTIKRKSTTEIKEDNESKQNKKLIKYNNENENEIQNFFFLLKNSIFVLHTNEKGKKPYIIYDHIFIGKNKIEINENKLKAIEEENKSSPTPNESYSRFLKFLDVIKKRIQNEFTHNYCLKIELIFQNDNSNNQNNIYDISCNYILYNPLNNKKSSFKDDNILINYTNLEGFSYMMYEINNESFKELKYEFTESNQKETVLKYQKKNSQMNLKQEKITNYPTINNNKKIDNTNQNSQKNISTKCSAENNIINKKADKEDSTNQNNQKNISTKCSTEFGNIYKEADKEEILTHIKIINSDNNNNNSENNNNNKKDIYNSSYYIIQLSNGCFISYGKDNKLIVYNQYYNIIGKKEDLGEYIYNISERQSDSENMIEIIVCCLKNIYLIKLNKKDLNFSKQFPIQIPNMSCFLCLETQKNQYIASGETSTIYCENIFKDEKVKPSTNKISNNVYRSGIKINDKIIALTSNSIIKNGKDNLSIFNTETKKIKKICEYSYVYDINGLSVMNIKGKKLLLCACKKYNPEQYNGILVVNLSNINNEIISEKFFDTDNFEVTCFRPILNIKNNNMEEIEETEYFLVGGFDSEKGEGIIRFYKAFCDTEENDFSIEYLQDIEFIYNDNDKFRGFEGSITCIEQSKINGNILITCSKPQIYLFSKPNLEYYTDVTEN